ncbi:hypothetical protein [Arenibaculum pallidiluteum]|uniref:hypothetical protein n=1 Tax=Arenibaculum pallidiluteum TaxID=2812559 RepID=UPI001A9614A8|nr:hypothetical protein [Arenibaculum pallidiluteum]
MAKKKSGSAFRPFANENQTLTLGDLNVENREDRVAVFGSVDLTRDRKGLEKARALKAVIDAVVTTLEADAELPDGVAPPKPPGTAVNPFG